MTDYKVQGRTMPKLILNITNMGKPFTLADFYVMISRVRSFDGLRLGEFDGAAMGKLLQLTPIEDLHAWENGYDQDGAWNGSRAIAALIALRCDRSKVATKRAEEKAVAKKVGATARAVVRKAKAKVARSAKAKAKAKGGEGDGKKRKRMALKQLNRN